MFAKIYRQIFESSIASNSDVRHVFMDLLVLADSSGVVDMTHNAIARITNVSEEQVVACIDELMKPEPASRSGKENGARLVLIDPAQRAWGWRIVNYGHYRQIRDEESRRSYCRGRRRAGCPSVYYAVCVDRVKIAFSANPWARVTKLKQTIPETELVAKEAGNLDLMRQRHEQFASDRLGKGWFKLTAHLQDHIAAVAVADRRVVGVVNGSHRVVKGSHRVVKGSQGSQKGSSRLPMKRKFGVVEGSHGVVEGSQRVVKKGVGEEEEEAEGYKVPSLPSLPERERQPAGTLITTFEEAKRLICERILNGKDPSRPWSYQAQEALSRQLPIPLIEIERVAWFRGLADDPKEPELVNRKSITENGLSMFWSDEVTRANAYWITVYGLPETEKKKEPPNWREFYRREHGDQVVLPHSFYQLDDRRQLEYEAEFPPRWKEFYRWKYDPTVRLPDSFHELDPDQRREYESDFQTFENVTRERQSA
jgi:hypothetical protein